MFLTTAAFLFQSNLQLGVVVTCCLLSLSLSLIAVTNVSTIVYRRKQEKEERKKASHHKRYMY